MFERIKDFFYDISDIFVSLLIIAVIFISVSWKISETLSVDIGADAPNPGDIVIIDPTPEPDVPELPETPEPTEPIEELPDSEDPVTETPEPTPPPAAVMEDFIVPDGATGYRIGQDLLAAGFIDDVNTFVSRLIALEKDSKLRSGTFKLSKADDLDTIIRILAGERR